MMSSWMGKMSLATRRKGRRIGFRGEPYRAGEQKPTEQQTGSVLELMPSLRPPSPRHNG